MRTLRNAGNAPSLMFMARSDVARQEIGSGVAKGKSVDFRVSGENGSIGGPDWDRNSKWMKFRDGPEKSGIELRECRSGVLYCATVNCCSLPRCSESMFVIVIKLDISRLMSANFSSEVGRCEVANFCSPLSLTPGRLSRRKDRSLGGSAFNVMFVKDVAGNPEIDRCCNIGNCRNVPMIARKFRVGANSPELRCSTKVDKNGCPELRSRKRSVGSQAAR